MRRSALLALLLMAGPAAAQQHAMTPQHWYPIECCSRQDCRPVACEDLEELPGGQVRDIQNGQTYTREMVRPSQDAKCHVCTHSGLPNSGPICVFTVNGS